MCTSRRSPRARRACASLLLLALGACGGPSDPPTGPSPGGEAGPAAGTDAAGTPSAPAPNASGQETLSAMLGGALDRGTPLPAGLIPGGDCPAAGDVVADLEALAGGRVPLKPGLTLTEVWTPNPAEEYECLLQVTEVTTAGVDATMSCDHPRKAREYKRRLCLGDLENAGVLVTQTGNVKVLGPSGEELPETIVGAGWFSLSRREFAELKRNGSVRHHYVQPAPGDLRRVEWEATAVLRRDAATTATIAVNDGLLEVPVIRASGEAHLRRFGRSEQGRVTALILDDERLPLLVEYAHTVEGAPEPVFRLSYARISFPATDRGTAGRGDLAPASAGVEQRLAARENVDVYGIYFAFNSDRIRRESMPTLEEIAGVLHRHPDWKLSIAGHTDGVGGDAANLELSRRRSEAVRTALVERFRIAPDRLSVTGHGAAAPKDRNDTPEGRARNRRVELTRR